MNQYFKNTASNGRQNFLTSTRNIMKYTRHMNTVVCGDSAAIVCAAFVLGKSNVHKL
jgi:hypothetical protein